ncbi:MAG: radical SAM protein [Candidatus Hydrogenedens sp.]|jgi:anaerobic ribonucleoside-triphosphate reductase activating protein|nr:radical SAM protein [Candidatus Hydrogenedens sp.]
MIRVHRFLSETEVEGPGKRAALWVQGCMRRCPGCFNEDTWPLEGGTRYSVEELDAMICRERNIEGITFLGGEPFLQAAALALLAKKCRERELSVVTFTGYDYKDIRSSEREDWLELLSMTDLLLSGPYLQEQQDFSRPWIGSSNQEFHFLSPRYRALKKEIFATDNAMELRVNEGGALEMNGMASEEEISEFKKQLAQLGLRITG